MRRAVSLMLVLSVVFWIAIRDFGTPLADYAQQDFDAAAAVANLGPDGAIESLSRTIDRQKAEKAPAASLAESYRLRGSYQLQNQEPNKALADFDEALRLNLGETVARFGRAECFRQLGHPDQANAEIQKIEQRTETLDLSDAFPGLKQTLARSAEFDDFLETPTAAWLLVGIAWIVLTVINIAAGRAQRAEAAGSVVRLLWVATALGVLESLPLAVWAGLGACEGIPQASGWFAVSATGICLIATLPVLSPPICMRVNGVNLPRVEDAEFLKRVAELAGRMHVSVPVVRLWRSITGSQQALAFAGTLQAPQLVVTDGILTRLAPLEQEAVVAHELGHIVNGTLWYLAAVTPVACAVATAVSAWFGPAFAVPFGLALVVGLRRLVSRPLERDSDRRAARAVGSRETIAALTKIHALLPLEDRGLLPLLLYATATHPSLEMRLCWLHAAAGDRVDLESCPRTIRSHRMAAAVALALWLLVLAGTLVAGIWAPQIPLVTAPLWIVAITPTVIKQLAQRRQISLANRRIGQSRWGRRLIVACVLVWLLIAYFPLWGSRLSTKLGGFSDPTSVLYPMLTLPLLAAVWLPAIFLLNRGQKNRTLRQKVAAAIQMHDFRRVLEIGRSASKAVARDPLLRYQMAFARAVAGDRPGAIAEFERLWRDHPRLPLTALSLAALLLDADQAERALAIAQSAIRRLPDDATTHLLAARALRRLGRLDESRQACNRARALDPRNGSAQAIGALISLDEGDLLQAQQAIARGLELSPGEPYILLCRAEIALKTQPLTNARVVVEEALATLRANPLAFFHADVERLHRVLVDLEAKSPVLESTAAEAFATA